MIIRQTNRFKRVAKKLRAKEKGCLDKAVNIIISAPKIGDLKKKDLSWLRVYRYKIKDHQYLLGYEYNEQEQVIILSALVPGAQRSRAMVV